MTEYEEKRISLKKRAASLSNNDGWLAVEEEINIQKESIANRLLNSNFDNLGQVQVLQAEYRTYAKIFNFVKNNK